MASSLLSHVCSRHWPQVRLLTLMTGDVVTGVLLVMEEAAVQLFGVVLFVLVFT